MVRGTVRLFLLTLVLSPGLDAQPVPGCLQERIAEVGANGVAIDADGDRVPFISNDDPLGTNPGRLNQIFLWREGSGFDRLVGTNRARTFDLTTDAAGRRIAFVSDAPITPGNAHRQQQVFLWVEGEGTRQITDHELDEVFESSLDASGTRIAFVRWVFEAPQSSPVSYDLVLWEEGVGERVLVSGEARLEAPAISGDGRRVAFLETPLVPDPPTRLRLWGEATGGVQTLLEAGGFVFPNLSDPSLDFEGDRIAFSGEIDPLGTNRDRGNEVFLWDEAEGLRQLTESAVGDGFRPSIAGDGRTVAFLSSVETGGTPNSPRVQVFLWRDAADGTMTVTRVTDWPPGPNPGLPGPGAADVKVSRDGRRLAHSRLHPGVGGDPSTAVEEVWISDCAAPLPPFDEWLRSPDLPGFEVQVRIGGERRGVLEPLCIPETLCVSGAVPLRSEVFVRVVGPKPNGRLWPTLVKLSTSEVEVWIRQLATGEIEYYRLPGARPGFDELPGLFDREGFEPSGPSTFS